MAHFTNGEKNKSILEMSRSDGRVTVEILAEGRRQRYVMWITGPGNLQHDKIK